MNHKLLRKVFSVYLPAAAVYTVYSGLTGTGLSGWLIDLQLRMFHQADDRITFLFTFLVVLAPVVLFDMYLRKRGLPGFGRLRTASPVHTAFETGRAWKILWIVGLTPFVISLAAYAYVMISAKADESRKIYPMDLSQTNELPAPNAKFLEMAAALQQDYQYELQETIGIKSTITYTPLTGASWTKHEPVHYILYLSTQGTSPVSIESFNPKTQRYDQAPSRGPYSSIFNVSLSHHSLPTYVKTAYEKRGIQIGQPIYVLDWEGNPEEKIASWERKIDEDGNVVQEGTTEEKTSGWARNSAKKTASDQKYYLIPILGAAFSLPCLIGGSLGLAILKKRQRRAMSDV